MLYYLFQYLEQFNFPGARMFGYVSFRSLMAVILSLLISAIFGEYFINLLKRSRLQRRSVMRLLTLLTSIRLVSRQWEVSLSS